MILFYGQIRVVSVLTMKLAHTQRRIERVMGQALAQLSSPRSQCPADGGHCGHPMRMGLPMVR